MGVEEILIHIAASSSTADDQRFRAMAATYDEFEPVSRFGLTDECRQSSMQYDKNDCEVFSPASASSSRIVTHEEIALSHVVQTEENASESPLRTDGMIRQESVAYAEDTPHAVGALESQLLTSSISMSPTHSPDAASARETSEHGSSQNCSFHTLPSETNIEGDRDETCEPAPAPEPVSSAAAEPYAGSLSFAFQSQRESTPGDSQSDPNILPDEVMPPSPRPAQNPAPTTYVTPQLLQLAGNLDLSKRYRPESVTREVGWDERGYWRIDTSPWSSDFQAQFWSEIVELIGSGRSGWGVWAHREPASHGDPSDDVHDIKDNDPKSSQETSNMKPGIQRPLGFVRVYCWGEIVGHIYLLLFLASGSRVKHLRAKWHDAEGEVIVQMP